MKSFGVALTAVLLVAIAWGCCATSGAQQFSHILSFQGRLCGTDGKPVPDGVYTAEFRIYDAETGGNALWREQQGVTQVGGVFVAYLGSVKAFPADLFAGGDRWLSIKAGADPEMPSRFRLTPSPWAIRAATADSATSADTVDGFHASSTPTPNYILPLDATGKFPSSVIPTDADWRLTGNAGTSPDTSFLGTTDKQALVFRTNNVEVARIDTAGRVGIGTTLPGYLLHVVNPSDSAGALAIYGLASSTGTLQRHWGVWGETRSTNTDNPGAGVMGFALGGNSSGVRGETASTSGTGVFGYAWAPSGTTYAVRGACSSPAGYAGYFQGRSYFSDSVGIGTTSPTYPLHVESPSDSDGVRAIYGLVSSTGTGAQHWGVYGETRSQNTSDPGAGVMGYATTGKSSGVCGQTAGTAGTGVFGYASAASGTPYAVRGMCNSPQGYAGYFSGRGYFSDNVGIGAASPTSILTVVDDNLAQPALSVTHTLENNGQPAILGVHSTTYDWGTGVKGIGGDCGVKGESPTTSGGYHTGVHGEAIGNSTTISNTGVYGFAQSGLINHGVWGYATGGNYAFGIYARAYGATYTYAGYFDGDVVVTGTLSKGGGSFKIDHPLDPENMYLSHSFVESPDMKNVYDGVVTLDARGEAWVELPEWFEALNRDFRYQLTCVGGFAPVYIEEEVHNNRFKIAGGRSGLRVSWQVTGIRQDPYANTHRIQVEEDKPEVERGRYLHPDAYGQPDEKGIGYSTRPKQAPR